MVVQLNATDLDFGGEGPLKYEIADGNDDGQFVIDPETGLVTVNESKGIANNYRLKVSPTVCNFYKCNSLMCVF